MGKYKINLLFILFLVVLSIPLISAQWTQFGNTPTIPQEEIASRSSLDDGYYNFSVGSGILINNYNYQVQPSNFFVEGNGYIAFVNQNSLRVYDRTLTLKASVAMPLTNPIPQVLLDSQGYLVAGSYNTSNIVISRYVFDGSSLSLFKSSMINLTNSNYTSGLTFDYGNILMLYDNPVQIGFIDLDTLLFNYTTSLNKEILTDYQPVPLAFDFDSNGVRDYMVFNASEIIVINQTGNTLSKLNVSSNAISQVYTIKDVKYVSENNQIIKAEAVSPKASPATSGFFNVSGINASSGSVIWSKRFDYIADVSVSAKYYPNNIQVALADLDLNSITDSLLILLQSYNSNNFQREYSVVALIDLTGTQLAVSPQLNITTGNKAYVPRQIVTHFLNGDEDNFALFSSGSYLVTYNFNKALFNMTIPITTVPSITSSQCIPANMITTEDITFVCSLNGTTSIFISNTTFTFTPSSTPTGSVNGSSSALNNGASALSSLFPDADTLPFKTRLIYVLLIMFMTAMLIIIPSGIVFHTVPTAIVWILMILEVLWFMYFVAIGYIPISVLILIGLAVVLIIVSILKGGR